MEGLMAKRSIDFNRILIFKNVVKNFIFSLPISKVTYPNKD